MATELNKKQRVSIQLKGTVDYRLGKNRAGEFDTVLESFYYCKAWLAEEKKRERFARMENNFVTPRTTQPERGKP